MKLTSVFTGILLTLQIVLIALYGVGTTYSNSSKDSNAMSNVGQTGAISSLYSFYTDSALMVFVGLGFLFAFLRKLSFSGVGLTLLFGAFSFQWSVLIVAFFKMLADLVQIEDSELHKIELGTTDIMEGLFGATSTIIALSCVLGKNPLIKLLVFSFFQAIFYGFNYWIGLLLQVSDAGRISYVWVFGAYFGLSASRFMDQRACRKSPNKSTNYQSDTLALIGAVFLWVLFPSFNTALAPPSGQYRVFINTILALITSVVFAFLSSRALRGGKFDLSDIQRATIAGGIGVGALADMGVSPAGAMAVGAVSAIVSTIGINFVDPFLSAKVGIYDSFYVNSTFGLPGIVSGIGSSIAAAIAADNGIYGVSVDDYFPKGSNQAGIQIVGIIVSVLIALLLGGIVGFICKKLPGNYSVFFTDENEFNVPSDFDFHVDEDASLKKKVDSPQNI